MRVLKWIAIVLLILVLIAALGYGCASYAAHQRLNAPVETHSIDFPVPWPLTEEEINEVRADDPDADIAAIEQERALVRGRHLLTARYGCIECHGHDLEGGVMVDDPAVGTLRGPNLTRGQGSVVTDYTTSDWDRIVRHGVKPDGTPTLMPSIDFLAMSDRELSDIIVYIDSLPPVDNEVVPVRLGPLGRVLIALGEIHVSAEHIDHFAEHPTLPPEPIAGVEFGAHLAQVCAGCHGLEYRGGPIAGSPPDWPPASNLTPHDEGLADWTLEEFETLLRTGRRPDGTLTRSPMLEVSELGEHMSDVEIEAMYLFFQSLEPRPSP